MQSCAFSCFCDHLAWHSRLGKAPSGAALASEGVKASEQHVLRWAGQNGSKPGLARQGLAAPRKTLSASFFLAAFLLAANERTSAFTQSCSCGRAGCRRPCCCGPACICCGWFTRCGRCTGADSCRPSSHGCRPARTGCFHLLVRHGFSQATRGRPWRI